MYLRNRVIFISRDKIYQKSFIHLYLLRLRLCWCVWKEFAQTPASTSSHAHLAGRVKVAGASIRVLTTQPVLVMDRSVTMVSVKRVVR
ncbi:hypothetical protein EB796_000129 [Bugula neritina]|uniref:Uncharacterized protein n=1 Tax=Bugula neritina TaxID=10212 RepID=A0A7J7KTP6_BUGNE|nr:hypothetical protein EB796_000129 [Bugula neritina]